MIITKTCAACDGNGLDSASIAVEKPCYACEGLGKWIWKTRYNIGDVIEYRDDETDQLIAGTVIDYGAPQYLEVAHDGRPEDDAGVHESLVSRIVPWQEYLHRMPAGVAVSAIQLSEVA